MSSRKIKLSSADGEIFEVEEQVAALSVTLRNMIEDGMTTDGKPIPLPNITSATLAKVLEFCVKHASAAAAADVAASGGTLADGESESVAKLELKAWDEEFAAMLGDFSTLFEVITASNFLDIRGLQDLMSERIAFLIKDMEVEEVRKIFGIKSDS